MPFFHPLFFSPSLFSKVKDIYFFFPLSLTMKRDGIATSPFPPFLTEEVKINMHTEGEQGARTLLFSLSLLFPSKIVIVKGVLSFVRLSSLFLSPSVGLEEKKFVIGPPFFFSPFSPPPPPRI